MEEKELTPLFRIIKIIWNNRKSLLIFNGTILILSVIILLLIPNQYKSSALISVKTDSNMMALPAILKDLPFGIGGAAGGDDILRIIGIGKSRTVLDSVIKKYDLHKYYDTEYRESTYEIVIDHLTILDNEDGTITISYFEEDPIFASNITQSFYDYIKNLDIAISLQQAERFRGFIEKRSAEAFLKLSVYEDSLKFFSEQTGLVDLENQLKLNVETLGELEKTKIEYEIQRDFLRENTNIHNSQVKQYETQIAVINEKINSFINDNQYSNLAVKDIPKNALQYLRLFRNVKIQETILEFLIPQVENAKIEEKKTYSSMILVDKPIPAEKKYKPQRTIILFVIMFLSFFISLIYFRISELIRSNQDIVNKIFKR